MQIILIFSSVFQIYSFFMYIIFKVVYFHICLKKHQQLYSTTYICLFGLRYVYTLRLIGPISYPAECDLMVNHESTASFSHGMHFVTFVRI